MGQLAMGASPGAGVLAGLLSTPEGKEIRTCIQCGTCAATCPYGEENVYTPRRIIATLRAGLISRVLESEAMLACVACYACMSKCPRNIRLTEVLLPAIKEQVFLGLAAVPPEMHKALENSMRYGNPMGESARKRAAWVPGAGVPVRILSQDPRPVDVLWFVECYPSYHPRGQDSSKALARILHRLGIDFAILGNEEKCAGETARLAGETGLFEALAESNIRAIQKYGVNRVLTAGAHAYDAFKNHYPALGLDKPVEHAVPFLAQRLDQIKLLLTKKLPYTITFHDACVLGRHNGRFEEPRALLRAIPGVRLIEMAHNRVNSICCGAGAGGMWLDTYFKSKGYERLSDRRVREALATGADVLAVSCPYEVSRFEDALKVLGGDKAMRVRDITELLAEAMED